MRLSLCGKNVHARNVSNAPSYLFTTVRHLSTDYLRKKTVRDRYAQMQLLTAETLSTTTDDLHEERIERLMTALGELSPRTRYVITACFLEHKKYKEVGDALGISVSAVKKHVVKGMRLLRARFKGNDS